jgi:Tfp pilus assembly protein PilF
MFSPLNRVLWGLATALTLCVGCVQTSEQTTHSRITIDNSLTYGKGLQENFNEARKATRENPGDPAPHYFLARTYMLQGNLDAAEVELRIIIGLSPESTAPYYELARIYTARNDYNTAIGTLESALRLDPDFAEAHYALARLYEKLGNPEQVTIHQEAYRNSLKARKAR